MRSHSRNSSKPKRFTLKRGERPKLRLRKLETAIKAGNAQEVDSIAHNCVGTSANLGMNAVVASLRGLETAGREGCLDNALPLLNEAKNQFERIAEFLQTQLMETVA